MEKRNSVRSEEGIVIIFLALMLFVLIGCLALAIDTALVATTRTQQQHTVNAAALGALEAYFGTPENAGGATAAARLAPKLAAAVTRAKAITHLDVHISQAANRFSDLTNAQDDLLLSTSNLPAEGDNGKVEPGLWYRSEPSDGCATYCSDNPSLCSGASACPCGDAGSPAFTAQCFQPTTDAESANAMRVSVKTSATSTVNTFFSKITGAASITTNSFAVATLTPRRAVFLLDLSRSATNDSHRNIKVNGSRNTYALFAEPKAGTVCDASTPTGNDVAFWDHLLDNGTPGFGDDDYHRLYSEDNKTYRDFWKFQNPRQNDFSCVTALRTGDEAGTAAWDDQVYLVDTVKTPEPLTSILQGLHMALQQFKNRAVKGDLVGVAGFDDGILPSRATLTEQYTGISAGVQDDFTVGLVPTTSSEFDAMMDATHVAGAESVTDAGISLQTRLNNKFLIPRYAGEISRVDGLRRGAGTDLPTALKAAQDMLRYGHALKIAEAVPAAPDVDFERSDNFIMVITDGVSNCEALTSPSNQRCKDDNNYFNTSFTLAQAALASAAANKISVYFVLTGDNVNPHNVLRKDGTGCLTEQRAKEVYHTLAAGDPLRPVLWTASMSANPYLAGGAPNTAFDRPNKYYQSIVDNGRWMPLRAACPTGVAYSGGIGALSDADCSSGLLVSKLENACATTTNAGAYPTAKPVLAGGTTVVDAHGRLMCDPQCRSKSDQMRKYITDIMGQNPFTLVQ